MHFCPFLPLVISLLVSRVVAHGVVESFTANGKTWEGEPFPDNPHNNGATPIRFVKDTGPVTDLSSPFLACGAPNPILKGGTVDAPVDAGSTVSAQWNPKWIHVIGPLDASMAECGGPCKEVEDPSKLKFFKIWQVAALDNSSNAWAQEAIHEGKPMTFKIPDKLKPGNYMIRVEIIALHTSPSEIYPECIQVEVQGSGNLVPKANQLIQFPSAYSADDAGFNLQVYDPGFDVHTYPFPGGPIADLVPGPEAGNPSGGSHTSAPTPDQTSSSSKRTKTSGASPTTTAPDVSPTATDTGSRNSCRRKRRQVRRRAVSRSL